MTEPSVAAEAGAVSENLFGAFGCQYGHDGHQVIRRVRLGGVEHQTALPTVGESDAFADWWKSSLISPPTKPADDAETIRFMDLFSSVGGLTLGFSDAARSVGLRPVPMLAADVDGGALSVYERNHRPRVAKLQSVRELVDVSWTGQGSRTRFTRQPKWASDDLARATRGVQAIVAGPPCQGHSSLNNHSRGDDPRNLLYLTVPALAVAANVDLVVIENVPNVVHDQHSVVSSAVSLLEQAGYQISVAVLAAHRLGWPQTRRRFFLVATRNLQTITLPQAMSVMERDALPVSWAIDDLLETTDADGCDTFNRSSSLSDANRSRVEWLFANKEYDLPNDERPDCHKDGHSYPAVYGRMRPDQPSGTITGGFLSPGRGRFVHPRVPRSLSPHEGARIQGFPDWFQFTGPDSESKRTQLAKWIGDAVPPILGFTAGVAALSSLDGFSDPR